MIPVLLAFSMFGAPGRYATGKELLAAVDQRLGSTRALQVDLVTTTPTGRDVATMSVLRGGYGKSEGPDEMSIQTPDGGWLVDKKHKTYEHLKKGEITVDPFIWHRWASPKDMIYGSVTESGTTYRTTLSSTAIDSRVVLEFDRKTLLPSMARILVGKSPEIEEARWTFRNFRFHPALSAASFDYHVSEAAHEVAASNNRDTLAVGSAAPDFRMQLANGGDTSLAKCLADHKGLLICFWFYACGACRQELPTLVKLNHDFGPQGLKVLTIDGVDSAGIVKQYYASQKVPIDAAVGITDQKALAAYKFGPCPMTILVSQDGKIAYAGIGFGGDASYKSLVAEIGKLGISQP
jgi:peroxiredoxin